MQVIDKIKHKPEDRRIVLTAWNPAALPEMALPPCHMFCQACKTNLCTTRPNLALAGATWPPLLVCAVDWVCVPGKVIDVCSQCVSSWLSRAVRSSGLPNTMLQGDHRQQH